MSFFDRALRTTVISAALLAACATTASAACLGAGTVNADGLRLRAEANTDSSVLTTTYTGANAVVLEDAGDGWYKVSYNGTEGYMSAEYVDLATQADVSLGYGKVETDGPALNVRSDASIDADVVTILNDGTVVNITGIDSGWYKIEYNGTAGYVSSDYLVPCQSTDGTVGSAASSALGQQIIAYAKQYLGCPYVYGGNGPNSFDCSGFTTYVYRHFGYSLNRTASGQLSNGVSVSRDNLQAGDLIFFYSGGSKPASHVGIYIGDNLFIHASTNSYTVEIDTLSAAHNAQKYIGARRII